MRDSESTQPIEGRDGVMMKASTTWKKWIPTIVMISWIYLASHLLQDAAPAAVKYTLLGGVIGVTEVLIGLSIAAGQVFPFAAGLIFLGTLLSSIPLFHAGSFSFPPDHWKIAVAFAGSVALAFSSWIRRMAQRLSIVHQFELLDGKTKAKCGTDPRDEDVEIMIRLEHQDFHLLRKPRCIVTLCHLKRSACSAARKLRSDSERGERSPREHDHRLPFWVK